MYLSKMTVAILDDLDYVVDARAVRVKQRAHYTIKEGFVSTSLRHHSGLCHVMPFWMTKIFMTIVCSLVLGAT